MATHWIPAEQALSIIADDPYDSAARLAICTRVFEGLIKTKARLLIMGDKRGENVSIPTTFWWATGHEALDQDWQTGDFATWIDRRIQCRAFGVLFDLDGLCEMLPSAKAALLSHSLSVAGDPEWITANAARAFMYDRLGANPLVAGGLLLDQCRLGFVAARAVLMQRADGERPDLWTEEAREWDIPVWFWEDFTATGSSAQSWERGVFSGRGRSPTGYGAITLSAVHFARSSMRAMLPAAWVETSDAPIAAAPSGRPPAIFWDDLWCAIFGDIFRGFQPASQGDIERAMLDWAAANGHDLGESTVKPRARKLLAEYRRRVENP